jgi:hypothetical protein
MKIQFLTRQLATLLILTGLLGVSAHTVMFVVGASPAQSSNSQAPAAVPLEPVAAILDAFRSHDIVALDEGDHGNEQGHEFRLSLIRDPRFPMIVNDIVVEVGNARYQDLIDRFVNGEAVPDERLRQVWQNTTQPHFVVDVPIYEEFFRAVRAVNMSVPNERRLRVVLGDPPIDWEAVERGEDPGKWLSIRDRHAADVVRREVLARHRRALVIYGGAHLQRRAIISNYERGEFDPLVGLLSAAGDARLFTIWTNTLVDMDVVQPQVASWPSPSLALLRGTVLGATDFAFYYPGMPRFAIRNGRPEPIARAEWRTWPMEEQFDAVLYVGSRSAITYARLPPSLCADAGYMKMRLSRMSLVPGPEAEVRRLTAYCAAQQGRE